MCWRNGGDVPPRAVVGRQHSGRPGLSLPSVLPINTEGESTKKRVEERGKTEGKKKNKERRERRGGEKERKREKNRGERGRRRRSNAPPYPPTTTSSVVATTTDNNHPPSRQVIFSLSLPRFLLFFLLSFCMQNVSNSAPTQNE